MTNVAVAAGARLGSWQVTTPAAPTGGAVHAQPEGAVTNSNVVPGGVGKVTVAPGAVCGPLLVTTMVYVTSSPAFTGSGASVIVTPRFASSRPMQATNASPAPPFVDWNAAPVTGKFADSVRPVTQHLSAMIPV